MKTKLFGLSVVLILGPNPFTNLIGRTVKSRRGTFVDPASTS
jgi:hypothetical protein